MILLSSQAFRSDVSLVANDSCRELLDAVRQCFQEYPAEKRNPRGVFFSPCFTLFLKVVAITTVRSTVAYRLQAMRMTSLSESLSVQVVRAAEKTLAELQHGIQHLELESAALPNAASDDDSERLSNLNSPDRTYLVSYSLDSYRPDIRYLDLDLEFSTAQKVVKNARSFSTRRK